MYFPHNILNVHVPMKCEYIVHLCSNIFTHTHTHKISYFIYIMKAITEYKITYNIYYIVQYINIY